MRKIDIAVVDDGIKIISQGYPRRRSVIVDRGDTSIEISGYPEITGKYVYLRGNGLCRDFYTLRTRRSTLRYLIVLAGLNDSSVSELAIDSWDFKGDERLNNINTISDDNVEMYELYYTAQHVSIFTEER